MSATHSLAVTLADWRQLRSDPQLSTAWLVWSEESIETADAIEPRIAALEDKLEGWCRRTSWAGRTPVSEVPDERGLPLDGEWVVDAGTGLRLLYDGARWRLITLTEAAGTGTPVLRETVALLATGGRRRLRYAVYWAAPVNDSAGLRRLACRLLGFEG
jgi:hypothetical protein